MGQPPRPDDLIEWTVTYAPEPGEAGAAAKPAVISTRARRAPTRGPRWLAVHLDWRVALLAVSPLLLALLTINLANAWNQYQLRRTLSAAVLAEDRDVLAGNLDGLRYSAGDADWLAAQVRRAANMQPAPLPLHSLWPATREPEVRAVRALGPTTARVEVARTYFAPDGRRAVFVAPQYYEYAGEAWQRRAPPPGMAGTIGRWQGHYLEASYYAADEAQVTAVAADLEATLTTACALWACPPGLRFDARFLLEDAAAVRPFDYFTPEPSTPWLFALLLSRREVFEGSLTMLAPAPHLAGVPADAASQHVYRSGLSLELLARLAAHLAPVDQRHSALRYALAARLGAELGLEAAAVAEARPGATIFSSDELWQLSFVSTEAPFGPFYTQAAQRQALRLVNNLLSGQDQAAAGRLFTGLATAADATAWAAEALRLTPADAVERLRAAPEAAIAPAMTQLDAGQTFTLGCRDGLAGLAVGRGSPRYTLVGQALDARPLAWSPSGDYVLTLIGGRAGVVAAKTGEVTWLPEVSGYLDHATWAADNVVAYTVWPYDTLRQRLDARAFSLRFFDAAHPERSPPPVAGVLAYAVSPDRTKAAVVLADASAQAFTRHGTVYLMPPLGGPLARVGEGQAPAWSPDGQALAYVRAEDRRLELRLHWPAQGRSRILPAQGGWQGTGEAQDLAAVWSPGGAAIALTARGGRGSAASAMWLISTADGATRWAAYSATRTYPRPAQFSADGHYLSVMAWGQYWPRLTVVVDAATGASVAQVPSAAGEAAWAPTGHALAIGSFEGLALRPEPAGGEVSRLTTEPCYAPLWN